LHDRLAIYAGHVAKVGSSLRGAVRSYNSAVGSFDSRVAISARRFKELGVPTTEEVPELDQLDIDIREITARHLPEAQLTLADGASEEEH
jgi:DNA recombination protein RmuC